MIPDTEIIQDVEKNPIPKGELKKMKVLVYEIHDHLQDLRGKRMIDQLHLSCLLTSCFCEKFEPLMMSNV